MNEGRELWQKYCGFFDKSFSEQVKYSEKKKEEYFKKWKSTKMARQLCPKGAKVFEDIPLTTYDDYPVLHKFGQRMEELEEAVSRNEGELWWDYYDRIGRQAASILDGWMVEDYALCVKSSGTTGGSKWFAHGRSYIKNVTKYSIASLIIGCSDDWGDTKIRKGDKVLAMMAPPPYGTAGATKAWNSLFSCVPPTEIMEETTDMRKKMNMVLKTIESGEGIDYVAALPQVLYLISQFLTTPARAFKDRYKSMHFGIGKVVLYIKYLQSKWNGPKEERVSEIASIKGLGIGATHYGLYLDLLKEQYGVDPNNIYVNSEAGVVMLGSLKCRHHFIPLLESNYLEFMTRDDEIKRIGELEKGIAYRLITTPFDSMLVRCDSGDLFRVVDFEQNGLPILSFESRVVSLIDIYGYLYLSEALASKVLIKAGLEATDAWAIAKLIEPTERLLLLMEKEWDYSEEEASRAVFNALKEISEDFRSLIRDFEIEQPSKFIEVEYLSKGAFMRYFMQRIKEGVPYGQMKPLKIINPEHSEVISRLREV